MTPEPFVITRVIDADMPSVWAIATDPALLPQWLTPAPDDLEVIRDEVGEGGSYEYRFAGPPDQPAMTMSGTYLEVWPPVRYLRTQDCGRGEPWSCAFRLTPTESGTEVAVIVHFPDVAPPADTLVAMRRETEGALERLERLTLAQPPL